MKCKVCNYDIPDGKMYCPVCNTKVVEHKAVRLEEPSLDMSWNTVDFPKPKKLEDIDMNWGNYNSYMNKDASEGFVSMKNQETKKPAPQLAPQSIPQPAPQPAPQPVYQPAPQPAQVASLVVERPVHQEPVFTTWTVPPQQKAPDTPLWYTQNFTASGVMKTGPAYPILQQTYTPAPEYKAPEYKHEYKPEYKVSEYQAPKDSQPIADPEKKEIPARIAEPVYQGLDSNQAAVAFQSVVPDATIQYMRVEPPKPVYTYTKPSAVFPHETQSKPAAAVQPVAPVKTPEPIKSYEPDYTDKKPEKFNTFIQKNEEFQKLLDREYERIHAIHGDDYDPIPQEPQIKTLAPETSVKAQGISAFERSLYGDRPKKDAPIQASPIFGEPAPTKTEAPRFAHDVDETELSLEELIADPLNPAFDIHTLEHTIQELKNQEAKEEAKRSERRAKLAAMEAAREAYFRSLDEEMGIPPKTTPAVSDASAIAVEEPKKAAGPVVVKVEEPVIKEEPKESVIVAAPAEPEKEEETPAAEAPAEKAEPSDEINELLSELPEAEGDESEAPAQDAQSEAQDNQENTETNETEEVADASAIEGLGDLDSTRDIEDITTELKGLYPDEDEVEEKPKKGMNFLLKFIIALAVLVGLLYLAQWGLQKWLPNLAATQTVVEIWNALLATVTDLIDKAQTAISSIKG